MFLKKAWITCHSRELATLTLESTYTDYRYIAAQPSTFPDIPTLENPKRHVVILSLFNDKDLTTLRDTIDHYLSSRQ